MKQSILLLLFTLFAMSGFSQFIVDAAEVEGNSDSDRITMYFKVTNKGVETDTYYWDLDRTGTFPAEWEISVCDCFTCYDWGQETALCDEPCELGSGEFFDFTVYVDPNGVVADGTLDFKLLDKCGDDSTIMATSTLSYLISPPSSDANLDASDVVIYPNPAFNSFQIADDENIESIVIYNIVGKEILAENHKSGKRHDVTDLEKGIYLVRMMDNTNEVVKVVRLTKE